MKIIIYISILTLTLFAFSAEDINQLKKTKVCNNCDFKGADLSNFDLSNIEAKGSDFSYSNLQKTNLSNANLKGAIFTNARLDEVNLSNAILDDTIVFEQNFKTINIEGLNVVNLVIQDSILTKEQCSYLLSQETRLKNVICR